MQNKMSGVPAEASQDASNDPAKVASSMDHVEGLPGTVSAEDAEEEAALKKEAVRAAEVAAAQQRKRTSNFDDESQRLRSAAGGGEVGEGAEDMDLLHP